MSAPRGIRPLIQSLVLVSLAGGLWLSWDALHDLGAAVAGMDELHAPVLPLVIDIVAVTSQLVIMYLPELRRRDRAFAWVALTLFSVASVIGNAASVAAVDPERLALGFWPAVAVRAAPAVAVMILAHMAGLVYRAAAPADERPESTQGDPRLAVVVPLAEAGMSHRKIEAETGIARSTVARLLRAAAAAAQTDTVVAA